MSSQGSAQAKGHQAASRKTPRVHNKTSSHMPGSDSRKTSHDTTEFPTEAEIPTSRFQRDNNKIKYNKIKQKTDTVGLNKTNKQKEERPRKAEETRDLVV